MTGGFTPRGTVVGTLMNHPSERDALGERAHQPPHHAPPRAPVLYIKPANTWSADGNAVALPAGETFLEAGATIGLVLGPPGQVAGAVLANDWTLPQPGWYRPPVRFNARDGFLGLGARLLPLGDADAAAALALAVRIDGTLVQTVRFNDLVRPPARLLAEIAGFMTLADGDVLLLGCAVPRPRVPAGAVVEIDGGPLGTLRQQVVPQAQA